MQTDFEHVTEIEAVSQGTDTARAPVVVESWMRCLNQHGLDPADRTKPYILPEREVRMHRERAQDLIRIARSGIEHLYQLVTGQNYVLLLSDASGVTVEYLGNEAQKDELRRSGLYMGAEWSEQRAGTCAVGACLETGEPLVIHQSDHFDATHGALSCTAAPIYDSKGRLAAVLDLSLLSSPIQRTSQSLALNLVRQTTRRIEMANLMAESHSDWVLRLASSPDFLDVDPEAALRLDQSGHVIGMTHGAARLIARTVGADWRRADGLIGRHVSDVFDLRPGTLEGLTRQRAARDRLIETRNGARLFAHAIEPQRRTPPRVARASRLPQALRGLAGDDSAMADLLRMAAALAPASMPLLIEGASGTGKSTLAAAIHEAGRRGPCVTVACETIAEDEAAVLFGRQDRRGHEPGLVDAAQGGTLIFDNPQELPPRLQARLLTLLGGQSFRRVGALREQCSTARIILTSAADLEAEVEAGRLRRDLLLRFSGARLALPALRQRRDIIWLAERMFAQALGRPVDLEGTAKDAIAFSGWEGNLHRLRNLAHAVAATCADRPGARVVITAQDLPTAPRTAPEACADEGARLRRCLAETDWNVSEVARRLGVNRSTVHRRIQRHGLSRRGR